MSIKCIDLSKATTFELLYSISHCIEAHILLSLRSSHYISIRTDESTDVSSKEELSICGRWLEKCKPVEHFSGITHCREVTASAITQHLLQFSKFLLRSFEIWDLMGRAQCQGGRVGCRYE